MEITLPSTFLWGTATAAHQVEGGNVYNDNWVMEHVPGSPNVEPSGDACDHYHRYRDDIALLADLGFTLYRFSLEWSRIEPEEGEFSLAQLDHYRRMLATCHEHADGDVPPLHFASLVSSFWRMGGPGHTGEVRAFLRTSCCSPGRLDAPGLYTERSQYWSAYWKHDG
jgi:beta-glucosidase